MWHNESFSPLYSGLCVHHQLSLDLSFSMCKTIIPEFPPAIKIL